MNNLSKIIIFSIVGFFVWIVFAWILMWKMWPSMMLLEDEVPYDFEETIKIYNDAVLAKWWKISTIHDLQETMKKYGKDVSRATVFELCHPDYAYEILSRSDERIVSAMMPCRVSFYEKDDGKVMCLEWIQSWCEKWCDELWQKRWK